MLLQTKSMTVAELLEEAMARGIDMDCKTSWSGSKSDSVNKGRLLANSQAKSKIRQVHRLLMRYIKPRLPQPQQAALSTKAPPKTPAAEYEKWLLALRDAAKMAQIEAGRYLLAREIRQRLDQPPDSEPIKPLTESLSGKKRKVAPNKPAHKLTVEAIANRIDGLGGIDKDDKVRKVKIDGDYLKLVLTTAQQDALIANRSSTAVQGEEEGGASEGEGGGASEGEGRDESDQGFEPGL